MDVQRRLISEVLRRLISEVLRRLISRLSPENGSTNDDAIIW